MSLIIPDSLWPELEAALAASAELVGWGLITEHQSLESNLYFLANYANDPDKDEELTICLLGSDFSPFGFTFSLYALAKPGHGLRPDQYPASRWPELVGRVLWFFGGLLFHGTHDGHGSGGAPTYSVCLTPTSGWAVHT